MAKFTKTQYKQMYRSVSNVIDTVVNISKRDKTGKRKKEFDAVIDALFVA